MGAMGEPPALGAWSSAQEKLVEAGRVLPDDPSHHELLGILGSARTDSTSQVSEGVSHLVRALRSRPASPYTWASLVTARYRLGEPGASLALALERAAALGPAEPRVQHVVADRGLAVWPEVGASTRQAIERMVAAGMRRNPLEMLPIAERRDRLEVACRYLDEGAARKAGIRWTRVCPRPDVTP